jgi:hypothetical protein
MTNPITPPPELLQRLYGLPQMRAIEAAFQAGADQELEACCAELESIPSPLGIPFGKMAGNALRAARRPKPPSLKEQALLQLDVLNADLAMHGLGTDLSQIRRALEQLPDNE